MDSEPLVKNLKKYAPILILGAVAFVVAPLALLFVSIFLSIQLNNIYGLIDLITSLLLRF